MKRIFTLIIIISITSFSCSNTNKNAKHKSLEKIIKENNKKPIEISKNNYESDTIRKHCNSVYLKSLFDNIENPSDKDIENFLLTFDESCKSKVEYLEFSNELLFDILYRYPNRVIIILSKNKNINQNLILKELEAPIHDGIDIKEIIKRTKKIDNDISNKIVKVLLNIPPIN